MLIIYVFVTLVETLVGICSYFLSLRCTPKNVFQRTRVFQIDVAWTWVNVNLVNFALVHPSFFILVNLKENRVLRLFLKRWQPRLIVKLTGFVFSRDALACVQAYLFGFRTSILAAEPRFASRRGEWGGEK